MWYWFLWFLSIITEDFFYPFLSWLLESGPCGNVEAYFCFALRQLLNKGLCPQRRPQLVGRSWGFNMLSVHTSNACFSWFGSVWVLYCTACGAKEHVIITTGALDSPFCTVVYLWWQAIGSSRGQTGFTAHVTVSISNVMIQWSLHRKKTSIYTIVKKLAFLRMNFINWIVMFKNR